MRFEARKPNRGVKVREGSSVSQRNVLEDFGSLKVHSLQHELPDCIERPLSK
jgi:hypothetical protein